MKRPEAFVDLHALSEDERIDMIGHTVTAHKKTVAFIVDDEPGKPERYIRKLTDRFPDVLVSTTLGGPVTGTVTIRVAPFDA